MDVADINKETILAALDNEDFSDLEDSLQNECANNVAVDCIVTRNIKDFKSASVPIITPKEFIELLARKEKLH